jgi:hypothetical protein
MLDKDSNNTTDHGSENHDELDLIPKAFEGLTDELMDSLAGGKPTGWSCVVGTCNND